MNINSSLNFSLALSGLCLSTMAVTDSFLQGVRAAEIYVNSNCKIMASYENTQESYEGIDGYEVVFRREITDKDKKLWFYMAKYVGDSSALFCLAKPGYVNGSLLNVKSIQQSFVDKISQEESSKNFLITIRHGNGWNLPMTLERLNLSNPQKPQLKTLKSWRGPGR